jgi:hypothetical protein
VALDEQARFLRLRIENLVAIGRDPAGDRDKAKADKSLNAVLEQFMAEHVKAKRKTSTAREYQRIAKLYVVPRLARKHRE